MARWLENSNPFLLSAIVFIFQSLFSFGSSIEHAAWPMYNSRLFRGDFTHIGPALFIYRSWKMATLRRPHVKRQSFCHSRKLAYCHARFSGARWDKESTEPNLLLCVSPTCAIKINYTKPGCIVWVWLELLLRFTKGVYRKLICQLNNIKSIFWVSRY